jgi:hypothetical protein
MCVLAVALGAITMPAAAGGEPQEWVLQNCVDASGKATTSPGSGAKCELKNTKNNQCLIRVAQPGQTDWNFASCDDHPKSMLFQKQGGGDLKCGDTVALELGLGGQNHTRWYRKCATPQTVGINICQDDVDQPEAKHFDWQLQCSGDIQTGRKFALYNKSQKDAVVYAKRPSKVADTCWNDKMKAGICASVRDE